MLGKTMELVRCCAMLSGMGVISRRAFAGVNNNIVIYRSGRNIVRAKPVNQLPVSASASPFTFNRKMSCSFATHATDDSAPIESPLINSMQVKIKEHLDAESVTVTDAYGDGRHVSISVVSAAFEGKSEVNRQRMVYKAIWEELQTTVHAVDHMTTKTPHEAAAGNS